MKKLALILFFLVSMNSLSQESKVNYSFYSALNFSKGAEIRGEFKDWYIGFHIENFINDNKDLINWGASIGLLKEYDYISFLAGGKVGFFIVNGSQKPSFGIELESDLYVSSSTFIGIRYAYDSIGNSTKTEFKTFSFSRVFIKIGFNLK